MTTRDTISAKSKDRSRNKGVITWNDDFVGRSGRKVGLGGGTVDFPLVVLVTLLAVFGIVMVFSASYYNSINDTGTPYTYLWSQGFYGITGFIIMMAISLFDYHIAKRIAWPLAVIGIILLLLVFSPLGVTVNGATRWLRVGPITAMPGEVVKAIIIILAASWFSAKSKRAESLVGILPIVCYTLLVCLLIVKQPNLSTAITVFLIAVGVAFVAGLQWRYIALMIGGIVGGGLYLTYIDKGYWHDRVVSFKDPFADALGDGFQVVQSLLALGTGGLWGKGLGQSVQKNLYLPEPQNDFILAIIGEELGFLGVLALMILYILLVWRLFYIAVRSKDNFGMLVCSGIAVMIGVQVLLNVAVVTSSMPATGIALPFVSAGGNSLWILMGMMGIALNVSRQGNVAMISNDDTTR